MKINQRAVIAKIFSDVVLRGRTLDDLFIQYKVTEEAFIKAHAYGLCRWYFSLDFIARKLLTKPLKEKDTDIYALILLGLHQIFYSDIKEHALVSETVEAAVALKKIWAKGLINACLRRALREKETFTFDQYSHAPWMINYLKKYWPNHWQTILEANNHQAPMTLRVNTKRTNELPEIATWLNKNALEISKNIFNLKTPCSVDQILGFNEGIISIQDQASQYAAPLLQLKPGEDVLDACAAPGGKTGHLLELESKIQLTALDISEQRLEKVKQNLKRLHLEKNVILEAIDATKTNFQENQFDKILLDAPCSGTGVIRRHPDIKLLRRESDLENFAQQQIALLNVLWPALKENGLLLYTTCSVMATENEEIIEFFLREHPDAQTKPIDLPIGFAQPHGWQCFPKINGHDGFYYCLLYKPKI